MSTLFTTFYVWAWLKVDMFVEKGFLGSIFAMDVSLYIMLDIFLPILHEVQ